MTYNMCMVIELTEYLTQLAQSVNHRITERQRTDADASEIVEYYTGLGLNALMAGGGYSGNLDGHQITHAGDLVMIDNPNSQIALVVSRGVTANKAAFALHNTMDDGSNEFSPGKHSSFSHAREAIAYRLGHQIINIALGLKNYE